MEVSWQAIQVRSAPYFAQVLGPDVAPPELELLSVCKALDVEGTGLLTVGAFGAFMKLGAPSKPEVRSPRAYELESARTRMAADDRERLARRAGAREMATTRARIVAEAQRIESTLEQMRQDDGDHSREPPPKTDRPSRRLSSYARMPSPPKTERQRQGHMLRRRDALRDEVPLDLIRLSRARSPPKAEQPSRRQSLEDRPSFRRRSLHGRVETRDTSPQTAVGPGALPSLSGETTSCAPCALDCGAVTQPADLLPRARAELACKRISSEYLPPKGKADYMRMSDTNRRVSTRDFSNEFFLTP